MLTRVRSDVAWPAILRPGTTAFRAHKTLADGVGKRSCAQTVSEGTHVGTATLRLFPGISIEGVKAFFDSPNIRGVVLETYGAAMRLAKQTFCESSRRRRIGAW